MIGLLTLLREYLHQVVQSLRWLLKAATRVKFQLAVKNLTASGETNSISCVARQNLFFAM
jgi:hypothetical protein